MRLCDFLRHLNGNLIIKLFKDNDDKFELFKEEPLDSLSDECNKSFDVLNGFDNSLWEKQVDKWSIYNDVVNILVTK